MPVVAALALAASTSSTSGSPNDSQASNTSGASNASNTSSASNASSSPNASDASSPSHGSDASDASNASNASWAAANGMGEYCEVSAPDDGSLGDCPPRLPSGSSCRPGCPEGHNLSRSVECVGRNLSTATCFPSSCNLSLAPEPANGRHGPQCLAMQVLQSGQTCEPVCNTNWSLSLPSSCSLGRLTLGTCVQCGAGRTFNDTTRDCQECPLDTYKADIGNDPCEPCPVGSNTPLAGASSRNECLCNSSTYRTSRRAAADIARSLLDSWRTGRRVARDIEPFVCASCPENAQIKGVLDGTLPEGLSVLDCKCVKPFIKPVRNASDNKELLGCRAPRACPLKRWLKKANLTGKQNWRLQLGECAAYMNESGMPSGQACLLECPDFSAPQVKADLLSAPNRQILCEDGVIVQHPPPGTWCSEASWTLPPLLFLIAVTLAAGVAMFNIERRQHSFEQACSRALANGIPQGQGGVWQNTKCKVA